MRYLIYVLLAVALSGCSTISIGQCVETVDMYGRVKRTCQITSEDPTGSYREGR